MNKATAIFNPSRFFTVPMPKTNLTCLARQKLKPSQIDWPKSLVNESVFRSSIPPDETIHEEPQLLDCPILSLKEKCLTQYRTYVCLRTMNA